MAILHLPWAEARSLDFRIVDRVIDNLRLPIALGVRRRLEEFILPDWKQKIKETRRITSGDKFDGQGHVQRHPTCRTPIVGSPSAIKNLVRHSTPSWRWRYVLNEKDSPDHAYPDGSDILRNLARSGTRGKPLPRRQNGPPADSAVRPR